MVYAYIYILIRHNFFCCFITSVNILQYLFVFSLSLLPFLPLPLKYEIHLLRYDTLIPPVKRMLYLCVELG